MSNFVSSVDFQQAQQTIRELHSEKAALESQLAELKDQLARSYRERDDSIAKLSEQLAEARKDTERWDRLEDKVARREVADMLREDPFSSLRDHVDRTLRILDHEGDAAGALRAKPETQDTP